MNWRKWKAGLCVAALSGLLTGVAAYQIADHIKIQAFVLFVLSSIAKDALLWLKSHPIPED
jgi:hypothetical protein